MSEEKIFQIPPSFAARAGVDAPRLRRMTDDASLHPERFWLEQSERLTWARRPTVASTSTFEDDVAIRWFADGRLNASVNCLDRHLAERGEQVALIWQGQDEGQVERLTYRDLHARVCRMANVLRGLGVGPGDRVAIHLPMVAEGVIAMLACARIGALHVVLFGGFSAEGLADRLIDSGAVVVITADEGRRGAKRIALKDTMDEALARDVRSVRHVLVLAVTGRDVPMRAGRDLALGPLLAGAASDCPAADMAAEDPLFLLYTSGSTGKPKGMVHTTGGYLVWASYTHELVFDHRAGDVFWCTADISWITGHTYVVYGPLANGGTVVLFEGLPSHPAPGRWWEVIDAHGVTTFYTAPTAIRALMRDGDGVVARHALDSLRLLGSVGEPISPDAWEWFYRVVGRGRCPVVDTWWQTETGGILIAPVPGAVPQKPGAATLPLPGVDCVLLSDKGAVIEGPGEGCLCIARSWPGQARTIWGDHARFRQAYFSFSAGYYFSGDGARRDADGYYWITGRIDDVINVSGHRIGTAEIEDVVATDHRFVECAAVGVPHDLKGQGLVVFAVPRDGAEAGLAEAASLAVTRGVGRYAVPERVFLVPDLPKTRSGKIVRRLLRKIACHELDGLGDLSTLADATIIDRLIAVVARTEAAAGVREEVAGS